MNTIQEEFKKYIDACYPKMVSENQGTQLQQAFFAGAFVVLHALDRAGKGEIPENEAGQWMEDRIKEAIEWHENRLT